MSQQKEPKGPMEPQSQPKPGLDSKMDPKPRYKAPLYKGADKLKGKAALITGGDSGIGRSVAVLYAREGADVAIVYLPAEQSDAEETKKAVEEEGRKCLLLPGDVRVAVADDVAGAAGDGLQQAAVIVAVQEGDAPLFPLDFAEAVVAGLPGDGDGFPQFVDVVVHVAEDEMRGPGGKQGHDCRRSDVAAMQDLVDLQALEHAHRFHGERQVTVGVADDSK